MGPSFSSFWSVKQLNFEQNLLIRTAHHTFLESKHLDVTKNPYYILFLVGRQKKASAHGLYVIIKLYVIRIYMLCIICLWSLFFQYEFMQVHIFYLSFWKTRSFSFCVLVLMSLYLWFLVFIFFVLYFEFNVILNNVRLNSIL